MRSTVSKGRGESAGGGSMTWLGLGLGVGLGLGLGLWLGLWLGLGLGLGFGLGLGLGSMTVIAKVEPSSHAPE